MGCGASSTAKGPMSQGSWGVGGPSLALDVYGPKPRVMRNTSKLAELRQMLAAALEGQKPLAAEQHRRLMCGMAFVSESHSAALVAAARRQWVLAVCSQMDMVVERELLHSDCLPTLREIARMLGMDLELCESRWEKNQERDASHSEEADRLRETQRAVRDSAGLALIVLLGDRLGTPSLPATIDATTFEAFLAQLARLGRSSERLTKSYERDTNPVPNVYTLKRIDKLVPHFLSLEDAAKREQAEKAWRRDFSAPMIEDIKLATLGMVKDGMLTQDESDQLLCPCAMRDALRGVSLDADISTSRGHARKATRSVLVHRHFLQMDPRDELAAEYIDVSQKAPDTEAACLLERVKCSLKKKICDENVLDFEVPWKTGGLDGGSRKGFDVANESHRMYLADFGDKITEVAAGVLAEQLSRQQKLSDIEYEVYQHMQWLERNSTDLIGREEARKRIRMFMEQKDENEEVATSSSTPSRRAGGSLVITGPQGCGKTKVMCAAVGDYLLDAQVDSMGSLPSAGKIQLTPIIVFRSIAFSHSIRSVRGLIYSLCRQLAAVLEHTDTLPTSTAELTVKLGMLLAEASDSRRVLIILDGLDQLVVDGSSCLHWLPVDSLPDNCYFVATVSSSSSANVNAQVYAELKDRLTNEAEWLCLHALVPEDQSLLLQFWLQRDQRQLTSHQTAVIVGTASAAQDGSTALLLRIGFCTSQTWTSWQPPPSISATTTIPASIDEFLKGIEARFNESLVALVLGGISVAQAGLTRTEIIDIVSTDENVLTELFKWAVPPYARAPPSAVSSLLHSIGSLVEERALHGSAPVVQWAHSSCRWYCKTRYDSPALRKKMLSYFSGEACASSKPFSAKENMARIRTVLSSDRQVATMPNTFSLINGKYRFNDRKMTELPPLLTNLHKWDDLVTFFCDRDVFDALSSPAYVAAYTAHWKAYFSSQSDGPEKVWSGFQSTLAKIEDSKSRAALSQRVAIFMHAELGMPELSLRFLEGSLHALVREKSADLDIADTLEQIAIVQHVGGDLEASIDKLDEVVSIRAKDLQPEHIKLTTPIMMAGDVLLKAGQTEEAMKRYNDVLRRLRGLDKPEYRLMVADITTRVADIHKNLGELDRAITRHEEAIRIRKTVLDPDHLAVAVNVSALALLYEKRGDLNDAISRFAEALQIRRSKLGPCHVDVASLYNNMAVVYESLGNLPEATKKYEEAVRVFRAKLGKDHIAVGTILNNLGNVYKTQGMFIKAAERYEESLVVRRKVLGHSLLVSDTLNSLAGVLLLLGNFDRSLDACMESMKIREELLGAEHLEVATMLNNIAGVRMKKGEFGEDVENILNKAFQIKSSQLGQDHVQVAEILNNIAILRDMQGNNIKALELTQRALSIQESKWGRNHVNTAHTMHCKALFHKRQGDFEESVAMCKAAIRARKELLGEDHLDVANSLQTLSEAELLQGNYQKAIESVAQALRIRRSKLGSQHADVAVCLHHAGQVYMALDRQDDTMQSYSEALAIRLKVLGHDHKDVAAVLKDIALLHWNCNSFDNAIKTMEEVLQIYRRTKAASEVEVADILNSLAALYWNQSDFVRAEQVCSCLSPCTRALELFPISRHVCADKSSLG